MRLPYTKPARFKSRRLLDAAEFQPCVLCQYEGVISIESTVPAHLPGAFYGMPAGMAEKVHDWLVAHVCDRHHAILDGPEGRKDPQLRLLALCLTLERLFDRRVLIVGTDWKP